MLLPLNALFGDDDDDDDASDAFSFRGVGATAVLRGNVLLVAAVFVRCVKLGLFCCADNDAEELFNCTLPMDRDDCKLNALTSFCDWLVPWSTSCCAWFRSSLDFATLFFTPPAFAGVFLNLMSSSLLPVKLAKYLSFSEKQKPNI